MVFQEKNYRKLYSFGGMKKIKEALLNEELKIPNSEGQAGIKFITS
jgi:hypothetical protein